MSNNNNNSNNFIFKTESGISQSLITTQEMSNYSTKT